MSIGSTSGSVANLYVLFKSKGLAQVITGMKVLDRAATATIRTLNILGGTAKTAFFLSGAGLTYATVEAIKYERALAEISTMLVHDTMPYMREYSKSLINLASQYGQTTDTLSRGLYDILSASVKASKGLDVLKQSAIFAVGGLTNVKTSADAITTVLNAYQLSALETADVTDLMFQTVKRGKIVAEELAQDIGKLAATAAIAGVKLQHMFAAIATMTRQGIKSDQAMTAMLGLLRAFLKPSDKAKEAAKKYGIELSVTALKADGLIGTIQKLSKVQEQDLGIIVGRIRGLKALSALIGDYTGLQNDANLMTFSGGRAMEAYRKNSETTNVELKRMWETVKNLFKAIGGQFLPVIKQLAIAVRNAGIGAGNNAKEWADWLTSILKTSARIVALVVILKTLMTVLSTIVKLLQLMNSINISSGLLNAFNGLSWLAKGGVVGGIIAGAAAIGTAIWAIVKAFKATEDPVRKAIKDLNNYAEATKNAKQKTADFMEAFEKRISRQKTLMNEYARLMLLEKQSGLSSEQSLSKLSLGQQLSSILGSDKFTKFESAWAKAITKATEKGIEQVDSEAILQKSGLDIRGKFQEPALIRSELEKAKKELEVLERSYRVSLKEKAKQFVKYEEAKKTYKTETPWTRAATNSYVIVLKHKDQIIKATEELSKNNKKMRELQERVKALSKELLLSEQKIQAAKKTADKQSEQAAIAKFAQFMRNQAKEEAYLIKYLDFIYGGKKDTKSKAELAGIAARKAKKDEAIALGLDLKDKKVQDTIKRAGKAAEKEVKDKEAAAKTRAKDAEIEKDKARRDKERIRINNELKQKLNNTKQGLESFKSSLISLLPSQQQKEIKKANLKEELAKLGIHVSSKLLNKLVGGFDDGSGRTFDFAGMNTALQNSLMKKDTIDEEIKAEIERTNTKLDKINNSINSLNNTAIAG